MGAEAGQLEQRSAPPARPAQAMGTSSRAMCHPYGNRCGGAAVSEKQTRSITSYKQSSELTQTKVRINKSEWHNEGCVWAVQYRIAIYYVHVANK